MLKVKEFEKTLKKFPKTPIVMVEESKEILKKNAKQISKGVPNSEMYESIDTVPKDMKEKQIVSGSYLIYKGTSVYFIIWK